VQVARDRAARGEGPSFIEAVTYRYRGHNTGEVANYREQDEIEQWRRTKDPIERLRRALEGAGLLDQGRFETLEENARAAVEDAIRFAEESPVPDPATATGGVTALPVDAKGPGTQ
jgi:TPP-dependent pyruvate/acetoin dehydrogenase alpha subunit